MSSRWVLRVCLSLGVAACGSTVGAETGEPDVASEVDRANSGGADREETDDGTGDAAADGTDDDSQASRADGGDAGAKPDGSPPGPKSDAGQTPACVPDAACAPANPCRTGTTTCESGVTTCAESTPVPDGTACGAGLSCQAGTCKTGSSVTANGTCTYREVPRVLSCPTGMSCRCYDSPWTKFKDAPSRLDLWRSGDTVEVLGGDVPDNAALSSPPSAVIALDASEPRTGAVTPYSVTVTDGTEVTVRLVRTVGYVAEKYIKYSSADCGHSGRTLDCTFRSP